MKVLLDEIPSVSETEKATIKPQRKSRMQFIIQLKKLSNQQ